MATSPAARPAEDPAAVPAGPARLAALRAAWLFDGVSSTLIPDPVVLIDGGAVRGVSSAGPIPPGATVIDLPGATLLPGLIDTHVHLAFDASPDPVGHLARRQDSEVVAAMEQAARAALSQLGYGQAEALRAITSVAAEVCGLGHCKGRIAPGFDADILAVDGDPIADPASLHCIRAVYVRGTPVPAAAPPPSGSIEPALDAPGQDQPRERTTVG